MSTKALSGYTRYAKYSRYIPEKQRRETWPETVERVFKMHEEHLGEKYEAIKDEIEFAKKAVLKRKVLGSQRALQFGGYPILSKNAKMYNCSASYIDRKEFFQECTYLLLCGCGVGFSVQKHHVEKLPKLVKRTKGKRVFVVPDSIEGWSDCVGVLMQSFFEDNSPYYIYDHKKEVESFSGYEVEFDFSHIRAKGAPISWGGVAPGPDGLRIAVGKIISLLEKAAEEREQLRPVDVYDVVMHASDAVLSGGIRRSATICMFSPDDEEMATAKTGDWFNTNPQRGRSNNSAVLLRGETTREQFASLMKSVKEFGEPGFVWADSTEILFNPCCEIGLYARTEEGESGFEFCNLCEINGKKTTSREEFLEACRAAAILGTIQASYDSFDYLSSATEEIVKREALLGVSMTGIQDAPEITLDPEIQKEGAQLILEVNEEIASKIGINKCARATCIKPAGTTSCILGTASGIHPHHAKRYFRRVQANKLEFPVQYFAMHNPAAVEDSVWSSNGTDQVITFLCEVPMGAKTKNQIGALELLGNVKETQQNWVEYGTRKGVSVHDWLRHNVSNTINVKPQEWDEVEEYIYENRAWYAGISLLPQSGDLDYPQAPFTSVLTHKEICEEFGEGAMFASGLIVDGLHAFKNNLWDACNTALGVGEKLEGMELPKEPSMPVKNGYNDREYATKLIQYGASLESYHEAKDAYDTLQLKLDWVRRFQQFAKRYVEGNERRCSHLLKHVHNWKLWLDLSREYIDVDWSVAVESDYSLEVDSLAGEACAGGACEIGELGKAIKDKTKRKTA